MNDITFITGNQHKVEALEHWLGRKLAHTKIDIEELQVLDPHLVAEHKAQEAFKILGKPVLVEDTSLTINALGRLPGVFIKWFLEEIGSDNICKMLKEFDDKSATARVLYVIYDGNDIQIFEGQVKGTIPHEPKGNNGFGWDSIFIPDGSIKTYAEMSHNDLGKFSVRNKAVLKLKTYLDKN